MFFNATILAGMEPPFHGSPIFPAIVLGLIILIIIINAIRFHKRIDKMEGWSKHHHWDHNDQPTAMEILNSRYANGEITDEEFINRKKHLLMTEKELRLMMMQDVSTDKQDED